jgi:hypothetical protein
MPARPKCGEQLAAAMRQVLLLRSTETCERTLMHPFEFPESSDGRGAKAVHLCPVAVITLAGVTRLHPQLLDSP